MEALKQELKKNIIEQLNLEDFSVEDIADDDALFGDGIGLDSIDALELIVMLDKSYGIKLTDPQKGKAVFASIKALAAYITEHRIN
ncbi:MAG: acyl carrier protein [Flavobacteriaceae bacterium]|jgi:acyl carrier protein|nr:acyl carrier protein [Flavobacteriaceae bacterium]MBT4951022.1 acyl carrier protein [Pelagibacteraceae bacterium]MBT4415590.1 acyl carrier protein [Flavobacteriaceae bacterium]MBT5858113.1 acyl carrier protein [Flavobacteriaceae bacterium]MBT6689386.1 acyl carrier protein [Flavobacteriaceae bacterium]